MILINVEHADGAVRKNVLELVTLGRELADESSMPLAALVAGVEPEGVATEIAKYVPSVYWVQNSGLEPMRAEPMTRAVAHAATTLGARVVLAPASRFGLSYIRPSARLCAVRSGVRVWHGHCASLWCA